MLKNPVTRKGAFTPIPKYIRRQVTRTRCSICFQPYNRVYTIGHGVRLPKQVIHHLIPRRWLNQHGIHEHHVLGLISICQFCHGQLKPAEDRLFNADTLGFLQINKRAGIDPERIIKFALSVGLAHFRGFRI
jgi:hypothetical protein